MFLAMHFNQVSTNITDYLAPHNPTLGFYSDGTTNGTLVPHCRKKFQQNYRRSMERNPDWMLALGGIICGRLRWETVLTELDLS